MEITENGKKKRFTKKEWSWIMYDWANSIYATNIMAAIFPTIFVNIAGDAGDIWWGYGTSIATFLVAILAPLLGALADYKGMKKKLFTGFMLTGVVFTFLIALVMNDWKLMLVGYIISRIGFSGSCLFYDSFLTDVTQLVDKRTTQCKVDILPVFFDGYNSSKLFDDSRKHNINILNVEHLF